MPSFISHRRVEFRDTDAAGIAHFSRFFTWMEEAEHEAVRSVGMSVMPNDQTPIDLQVGWPRVSSTCDYFRPLRFEDEFQVAVSVTELSDKSVTYLFEFSHGPHAIAKGSMTAVCCRLVDGTIRSTPIPDVLRERLSHLRVDSAR